MELYKRFRPKRLSQLVGNTATVNTLKNMLERKSLPHTIMFTGPSGCGKTTLGRIVRRELGCGLADYRELNCSDFRGIDTIREISKHMTLAPIGGRCRVFLMDEVHQLSKDGQNAALKILEDTPKHVYFILCTTDPGKLLKTIQTRCCQLPVSSLSDDDLTKLVKRVATQVDSSIKLNNDDVEDLVLASQGSARTALVLLDKILYLEPDERSAALKQKIEEENEAIELCRALLKKRPWQEVSKIIKGLKEEPEQIRWAVLGYARSVLLSSRNNQAYLIIRAFENNFYDSKGAGLARACFEAIFGE